MTTQEILRKHGIVVNKTNTMSYSYLANCKQAMIEFATFHVQAALEAADNKAEVEVVDYEDSSFNLSDPPTPIYGVDSDSILNSYPIINIK